MASTNQQKYTSPNPLRKIFLGPFQQKFIRAVTSCRPSSLLEVGAGEGYLLVALQPHLGHIPVVGLDLDPAWVAEGRRLWPALDLRVGDIYRLPPANRSWDVVVASEVLEHLERPADALRELRRVSQRAVVLSVPWEPWFRGLNFLRGKHWSRGGNHPEHLQRWTPRQFSQLVASVLTVERVIPAFPWTIIVAKV